MDHVIVIDYPSSPGSDIGPYANTDSDDSDIGSYTDNNPEDSDKAQIYDPNAKNGGLFDDLKSTRDGKDDIDVEDHRLRP